MSSTAKPERRSAPARRVAGAARRLGLAVGLLGLASGTAAAEPVTRAFDCPALQERFELDVPPGAQPWVEGAQGVEFRLYWHPEGQWQEADADIAIEFLSPEVVRVTIRDTVEYYWGSDTYLNTATGTYSRLVQQGEPPGWHLVDGRCSVVVRG